MSDESRASSGDDGLRPDWRKVLAVLLLGYGVLFLLGVALGAAVAVFTGAERPLVKIAVALAALAGAAGAGWGLVRLWPWRGGEPMAPRTRKARNLLWASGALGAIIGITLSVGAMTTSEPLSMFSNSPLPPAAVIPVLAVWLLIVPLVSWQWHRNVDEHEAAAYRFGALAGIYLYAFLTPAWWLAARAGFMPHPDPMAIYLVILAVWGAGWCWRRYR